MAYQRLHTLLCDLPQIQSRQDQQSRLKQIFLWFKDQDRLINQRKCQGHIRYEVTKQWRNWVQEEQNKLHNPQEKVQDVSKYQNPNQIISRLIGPYQKNARTSHPQIQIPSKRLVQYKRKIINIAPFIDTKQQTKPPRVLYPMPPKVQQHKQQQPEDQQQDGQHRPEQPVDGQQAKEGEQQKPPQEGGQNKQQANNQMDVGGFGEDKDQAEDDQPPQEQGDDKLAPKNKIFTSPVTPINQKRKLYRAPYMFFKGEEMTPQRAMENKYIKIQQDKLKKQKEEEQFIELAHVWGKGKSKMEKQLQRKLEIMTLKPKYSLSSEQPPPIQRLDAKDQIKYGLTLPVRKSLNNPEIDLTGGSLPAIDRNLVNEKSIRKDRLKSLKNKFGKMLNLSEYQERETIPSLCQHTSRRRNLSEIIRDHSKSKERLGQLQEITRIKEKMTRGKLGINIRALSQGLVLPQDQDKSETMVFPAKQLPANPFWVQTSKKKKKTK